LSFRELRVDMANLDYERIVRLAKRPIWSLPLMIQGDTKKENTEVENE